MLVMAVKNTGGTPIHFWLGQLIVTVVLQESVVPISKLFPDSRTLEFKLKVGLEFAIFGFCIFPIPAFDKKAEVIQKTIRKQLVTI